MRGRKPKPPALKLLQGNPGKRQIRSQEASIQGEIPRCPAWLCREARREWRRVTPHLARMGLLSQLDRAALAGYCQSWARYVEAQAIVDAEGFVIDGHRGVKVAHPAIRVARNELALMKAFCAEFGLTPSSRSKLSTGGGEVEADPFEDWNRGRNGAS